MSNIFERYENHTPFILMADIPPNPLDKDAVKQYQDLGLNTFILTEDDVPFTKNGVITEAYQNAIRNLFKIPAKISKAATMAHLIKCPLVTSQMNLRLSPLSKDSTWRMSLIWRI